MFTSGHKEKKKEKNNRLYVHVTQTMQYFLL